MQAADVMTFGAASIRPGAPIEEAARLMLQDRIRGLPVVDDEGDLVGMVTEGDLLRRQNGVETGLGGSSSCSARERMRAALPRRTLQPLGRS